MPYLTITHLIGKPDPTTGGWLHPRPPAGRVREQLDAAARSYDRVRVRIRPGILAAPIVSDVRKMCGVLLDQLSRGGEVRVTMDYGRVDPQTRRHVGAQVQTYRDGEIYEATATEAFRLLNTPPYHFIFEEVIGDGAAGAPSMLTSPSRPADATQVAELEATNRYLQSEVNQLKQMFEAMSAQQAKASAAPTTTKRNLKAALGDTDAQES